MTIEYALRLAVVIAQSLVGALWFYTANGHLLRGR